MLLRVRPTVSRRSAAFGLDERSMGVRPSGEKCIPDSRGNPATFSRRSVDTLSTFVRAEADTDLSSDPWSAPKEVGVAPSAREIVKRYPWLRA